MVLKNFWRRIKIFLCSYRKTWTREKNIYIYIFHDLTPLPIHFPVNYCVRLLNWSNFSSDYIVVYKILENHVRTRDPNKAKRLKPNFHPFRIASFWGSCCCYYDKGSQGSHIAQLVDISMLNTNLYVILICSLKFWPKNKLLKLFN